MTNQRQALNRTDHAGLTLGSVKTLYHTAHIMAIPVVAAEAALIAREYVLVFEKDEPKAIALLGNRPDSNSYVNQEGRWLARYMPALIRAYPFSLQVVDSDASGEEKFNILIDPNAPHFSVGGGEPVLTEQGEPTELLGKVQKTLLEIHRNMALTSRQINQLAELNLLVERSISIKTQGVALEGFRVVDEERLSQLTGEQLVALRDSGALKLAHAQLSSLANAADSPLIRNPDLEVVEAPLAATENEDFELDFSQFLRKDH